MPNIWLNPSDISDRITVATFNAIFDDANSPGNLNQSAIDAVIEDAEGEVLSWLDELGPPPFTNQVLTDLGNDKLLKRAAADYAVLYAFERNPEYVRAHAKEMERRQKRADLRMKNVKEARQRPPALPEVPANVGGVNVDNAARIVTDSPNGTYNAGDY